MAPEFTVMVYTARSGAGSWAAAGMLMAKRGQANDKALSEGDVVMNMTSSSVQAKARPRSSIGHCSEVGRKMLKVFLSNHKICDDTQSAAAERKPSNPRSFMKKVKSLPCLQGQVKEVKTSRTFRLRKRKHGSLPDLVRTSSS